jgi:hypothetical protein
MNRSAVGSERITHGFKPMPRDREPVIYTEERLNRKMRDERNPSTPEEEESILDSCSDGVGYLIRKEICELIEIAGLTPAEKRICWAVAIGVSDGQLAREWGTNRHWAFIKMRRIRSKMRRAAARYPYAGLWEVYKHETCRIEK